MRAFVLMISMVLMTISCGSQIYLDPATLNSSIENKEFDFNATRAFPTNYDVINVLNSMPGSTSTRLMNLDPGYGFNLKKDLFSVALPYFGRAFNVNPGDATKGGLTFESKEFTVKQSTSKKGNTLLVITPRDQRENYVFNLEIFKNGSAFLSIQSNNRQPISFDGNISAPK
ncbi:DUF4251 domain-containing protein [Epilithonimonas arachidiradicis]|uniref:Uncharacterized protein DUF4251 n=1 Tax=Epilithonimonas arachidiradicis TaxID=1617282 RepID=A0A420DCV8_9FLAO|nr:DUF4251 domain-containing protein [Epilithonimonas arachidiradicis]RKE89711.1 uncharacterized protein DUF4251 [Epilithonimonas arachidiradicis]GGG44679.1 hypothetical protein GCM10007332_02710 [Epilithonimonas arachidiradicis]